MMCTRMALLPLLGFAAACIPASAQSVVSTHSGLVYFFDGSVYLGNQKLEQKFGRFPDVGDGGELRTEHGRAEVLLTPGSFLRIGDSSAIRLVSGKFSDTRVELLSGSAILESGEPAANTGVTVVFQQWQVTLPHEGVYRIDSNPARLTVYKGEAEVSAGKSDPVKVDRDQTMPLTSILVPENSPLTQGDDFQNWAMSHSHAISSDNATAADIIDDPTAIENSEDAVGALSYFPLTGIPGVAITNPYGLSFWSPFQSTLTSMYFPIHSYGALYPLGWPATSLHSLWRPLGIGSSGLPIGIGLHPGVGITPLRPPTTYSPPHSMPRYSPPHAPAPHPGVAPHAVGHR